MEWNVIGLCDSTLNWRRSESRNTVLLLCTCKFSAEVYYKQTKLSFSCTKEKHSTTLIRILTCTATKFKVWQSKTIQLSKASKSKASYLQCTIHLPTTPVNFITFQVQAEIVAEPAKTSLGHGQLNNLRAGKLSLLIFWEYWLSGLSSFTFIG